MSAISPIHKPLAGAGRHTFLVSRHRIHVSSRPGDSARCSALRRRRRRLYTVYTSDPPLLQHSYGKARISGGEAHSSVRQPLKVRHYLAGEGLLVPAAAEESRRAHLYDYHSHIHIIHSVPLLVNLDLLRLGRFHTLTRSREPSRITINKQSDSLGMVASQRGRVGRIL
jgi:hypothetical protein